MKYLCVSVIIGYFQNSILTNKIIKKDSETKYILFTDNNKDTIKNDFWDIIHIDIDNIKKKYNLSHKVKISRLFKFNIFNILKDYFLTDNFKYYIYCDSGYIPNVTTNFKELIHNSNKSNIGLSQQIHPVKNMSLNKEMNLIINAKKETKENIDKTRIFLKNIYNDNTKFEYVLNKQEYFENSIIIYHLENNNLETFLTEFNNLYYKCPTYRDQPLWNFLLQYNNYEPIIQNNIKKNFYTIERKNLNINDYN